MKALRVPPSLFISYALSSPFPLPSSNTLPLQDTRVTLETERILSFALASFRGRACRVKGRTVDEVTEIKNQDIAKHLSLPPVKLHCSMLAEDAIKAAVKDLKQKQKS